MLWNSWDDVEPEPVGEIPPHLCAATRSRGRGVEGSRHAVMTTLSTRIHNMNCAGLCEFSNSENLSRILNRGC